MSEVDLMCDEGESALGGWSPLHVATHRHGETATSTACLRAPFHETRRSHTLQYVVITTSDGNSLQTEPPSSASDFTLSPCGSVRQEVNIFAQYGVDLNLPELLVLVNQRHTGEIEEMLRYLRKKETCVVHQPSVSGTGSVRSMDRAAPLTWILKTQMELGISLTSVCFAVNYLDRILASVGNKLTEVPFSSLSNVEILLHVVCLRLGCKMDETAEFTAYELQVKSVEEGYPYFHPEWVNKMEELVLHELNWELFPVVPVAYVNQLLCILIPGPINKSCAVGDEIKAQRVWACNFAKLLELIQRVLQRFLFEYVVLPFLPSELACVAVLAALEKEDVCPSNATMQLSEALQLPEERIMWCKHALSHLVSSSISTAYVSHDFEDQRPASSRSSIIPGTPPAQEEDMPNIRKSPYGGAVLREFNYAQRDLKRKRDHDDMHNGCPQGS